MISTWFLVWFGLVWNFDATRFDARTYMSTTSSARAHAIHTLRALDRHKRIWITLDYFGLEGLEGKLKSWGIFITDSEAFWNFGKLGAHRDTQLHYSIRCSASRYHLLNSISISRQRNVSRIAKSQLHSITRLIQRIHQQFSLDRLRQ